MDITILAAWGEFLGGIAVVVSLIYLASQIRQNSKLLRASTASVTHETTTRIPVLTAENPDASRIYWDGLSDPTALSESDRHRFDPMIATYINGVRLEHEFAQDGILSPTIWTSRVRTTRWLLQQPGARQWWDEWSKNLYDDDFIVFVNGLIREGEAAE